MAGRCMMLPGIRGDETKYAKQPLPGYAGFRVGLVAAGTLPEIKPVSTIYEVKPAYKVKRYGRRASEILMPNRTAVLMKIQTLNHPFDRNGSQLRTIYTTYKTRLPVV